MRLGTALAGPDNMVPGRTIQPRRKPDEDKPAPQPAPKK